MAMKMNKTLKKFADKHKRQCAHITAKAMSGRYSQKEIDGMVKEEYKKSLGYGQ